MEDVAGEEGNAMEEDKSTLVEDFG